MEQLIEFIGNHPFLVTGFMVIAGMLGWSLFGAQLQGLEGITPQEATLKISHDEAIVVDVREDNEFKQGHILNAIHIPMGQLTNKLNRLEKHQTQPVILSCATGSRSAQACHILKKNGFEHVFNLTGGIMAWQNANLPLAKK